MWNSSNRKTYWGIFMPLFYIVSGYTQRGGGGGYYRRKIVTITKKYFIYSFILLAVWMIACIVRSDFSSVDFLRKCFGIVYSRNQVYLVGCSTYNIMDLDQMCNGPLWFLTSYATSMGAYVILNRLTQKYNKNAVICMFLGLHMLCSCLPILLPWSIDLAFAGALFMLTGKELKEKAVIGSKHNPVLVICIVLLIFVIVGELNGVTNMSTRLYGDWGIVSSLAFILTGICGSFLLLTFCYMMSGWRINKALTVVGKNTLNVLTFHLLVFKLFPTVNIENGMIKFYLYSICVVLTTTFIIVGASLVLKKCVNQKRVGRKNQKNESTIWKDYFR